MKVEKYGFDDGQEVGFVIGRNLVKKETESMKKREAQQYKNIGYREGIEEGKSDEKKEAIRELKYVIAVNLFKTTLNINEISKVINLPISTLTELKKKHNIR